jgi:hypothetical protein
MLFEFPRSAEVDLDIIQMPYEGLFTYYKLYDSYGVNAKTQNMNKVRGVVHGQ